jgi:hypothetical protein
MEIKFPLNIFKNEIILEFWNFEYILGLGFQSISIKLMYVVCAIDIFWSL